MTGAGSCADHLQNPPRQLLEPMVNVDADFGVVLLKLRQQFLLFTIVQQLVSHGEKQVVLFPDVRWIKLNELAKSADQRLLASARSAYIGFGRKLQIGHQAPTFLMLVKKNCQRTAAHGYSLLLQELKQKIVLFFPRRSEERRVGK